MNEPEISYALDAEALHAKQGVATDMRVQVAIVGAGFTGITVALELAERGYHVCVLEARQAGHGCSGRNGGHLMQGMQGWPPDFSALRRKQPDALLDVVWEAGLEGVEIVRRRTDTHKIDCGLKFGYVLAALHQAHMRELELRKISWEMRGYQGLTLLPSREDVQRHVSTEFFCGGLHDAHSGQVQPLQYLRGLTNAAVNAGAEIYEQAPVHALRAGQPAVLAVGSKTVGADHVVLCGNAYLQYIGSAEMRSRIATINSSMIATEPLGADVARSLLPELATVIDCNTNRNWFRIGADMRMVFGGRAMAAKRGATDVKHLLARRMRKILPLTENVKVDYCWSGNVGITMNRLPHLGRIGKNTLFAQGFSGHGVALSGACGRIIAEDIAGETNRFAQLAKIRHWPFPGGPLRAPAVALGLQWYKFLDYVKSIY